MKQTHKKIMPLAIVMFSLAAMFYFYEFLLQVSPAIMSDQLMAAFQISAGTLGLISSVYFYSYTLMQVPAGMLYDKLGAKKVITGAATICALGSLLFGLAPNVTISGLARFLMGTGSACAYLGVLAVCVRWIPARNFPIFAGLAQSLGSLGAATGQAPLATLINTYGWRHSVFVLGIIGFILAFLIYTLLKDGPNQKTFQFKPKKHPHFKTAIKDIVKKPQNWWVSAFALLIWTPMPIFASLWGVPFFMAKYHLTNVHAGTLIAMIWIGTAFGGPFLGWLTLHFKRRHILMSSATLGLAVSLFMIYMSSLSYTACAICSLLYGIACSSQAITFSFVRDNNDNNIVGTAMGFNNMAVVLGGAIFQPVVGVILDNHWQGRILNGAHIYNIHSYEIALICVPLCFIVGIFVMKFFVKEKKLYN